MNNTNFNPNSFLDRAHGRDEALRAGGDALYTELTQNIALVIEKMHRYFRIAIKREDQRSGSTIVLTTSKPGHLEISFDHDDKVVIAIGGDKPDRRIFPVVARGDGPSFQLGFDSAQDSNKFYSPILLAEYLVATVLTGMNIGL